MNVLEKTGKILTEPVCDHCLGRQFAQLLSGYDNAQRGRTLRLIAAMSIDNEKITPLLDMSNFHDYKFHNLEIKIGERKKCSVCDGLFLRLGSLVEMAAKKAGKYGFKTFLVGTKLSFDLIEKEEDLWERVGIDYCEPLKAEINREVGKILEKKLKAKFNQKPAINIILDLSDSSIDIEVNPLFVYGEYQKLVRGIPQTKWPSRKYKTSVEQIIAKPFMGASKGKGHKLHGLGREDIDARCLAWRPFVLEILKPFKRDFNFQKLAKKIDKRVQVRKLRLSGIGEVRKIKEARIDKTYRAIVICDKKIARKDLKILHKLKEIKQKTPQRVLHRRADRFRQRKVRSIKAKYINSKKFILEVRTEAGLYIKELISGDSDRTQPNVSMLLGAQCTCKELDVTKIHTNEKK